MSDFVFLSQPPPPPKQRITHLHAWIATNPNGSEGILGIASSGLPLVTSMRSLAESLESVARQTAEAAAAAGEPCTYRLATFALVAAPGASGS